MQACFDAFADERGFLGVKDAAWDRCTDALSACGDHERDACMSSILCEHFLNIGTEIIITGLQARPELNGFVGTLIGAPQDGRVPTQVRNTAQDLVRLRLPNLRPIGQWSSGVAGGDGELFVPARGLAGGDTLRTLDQHERPIGQWSSGVAGGLADHAPGGDTMRTVDQHDGRCYLHTVGACARGAARELFVRGVPHCKARSAARLLNFLVSRMDDSHTVSEPQYCQCSGLQMEVAIHPPEHARDLSAEYGLGLSGGMELIEMIPLLPVRAADTPEMWSRVPTLADQANRGVPKQQLGMPQVLPHQGDILQLDVARAAEAGDEAAVRAYLEDGGYVDARLSGAGATLLMLAAGQGLARLAVLLLARGAEPNLRHAAAGTALMSAAEKGHAPVVKQLLRSKADPKLVDGDGSSALDFANAHGGHSATVEALRGKAKGKKK